MSGALRYCDALAGVARSRPQQVALLDDLHEVTYADLWDTTEVVASSLLREVGLQPGQRVLLALSPGIPYCVVLLACLRVGVVPVPLNTRLTDVELAAFARPLSARALVADADFANILADGGLQRVVLGGASQARLRDRLEGLWTHDRSVELPMPREDAPALVIGTGGTTGTPKGAFLTHRALLLWTMSVLFNEIRAQRDLELYISPFFHISIITGWMSTLLTGARSRIYPRFDAGRILQGIREGGSYIMGAATVFTAIQDHPDMGRTDTADVRQITWGGMASSQAFTERLLAGFPRARLSNSYAATEFGPVTRVYHEDIVAGRRTGVGRALPGVSAVPVDEEGRALPPGEIGELAIRAPWQMSGYWGKSSESEQVWRDGYVRIGDLGWQEPDGWLVMAGRRKEMYVSGGENVFPSEVEDVLARHPAVGEVVVYAAADAYWGERIEAAVVLREPADAEEILAAARTDLAGYKVPKHLMFLPEIPLTGNRKPDRLAIARLAAAQEAAANQTPSTKAT